MEKLFYFSLCIYTYHFCCVIKAMKSNKCRVGKKLSSEKMKLPFIFEQELSLILCFRAQVDIRAFSFYASSPASVAVKRNVT